jgi:5S rRNA maturation endonuclease (ribonuclease M5)
MSLEEIVSLFPGGRWRGDEWDCRCPCHDDRIASLSLSTGRDGKIVLCCQAGCDSSAILAARGLSWADLNGASPNGREPPAETVYRYDDESGNALYEIVRTPEKKFLARLPGTDIYKVAGVRRVLYGLPELLRTKPGEVVGICEGEKDVQTLRRHGLAATTNVFGAAASGQATKWKPEYSQWIKDNLPGRRFAIFPDNDAAGKAHAEAVCQSLTAAGLEVFIVRMDGLGAKEDVTDWLRTRTTADLMGLLKGNTPTRPRSFTAAELMRKKIEPTQYVVPGFFAEGLNLLCGAPKIGKSFLTMGVAVAVATPGGRAFGAIPTEHGSVLYLALEDGEGRLQKRLDLILGGSPGPEKLRFYDEWPAVDAGGLALLKEEMATFDDLRLVVIDVFGKIRAQQKPNGNVYQQDYREMAALKRLADEFRVCMVLIHHLNKGDHEDPLAQISGSMGLAGGADAVLILKRPRGRAEGYLFVTGRDVEEREVALLMAPEAGTWTFLGDADEYRRSAERKEILALLKQYPDGLQPVGIADLLERNRNTIRSLLFRMVYDGEIRLVGGVYYELGKGPRERLF